MRGVIKNVDNIKIESNFCLNHIGELFLVRKMVKMGEDRNENWVKPRAQIELHQSGPFYTTYRLFLDVFKYEDILYPLKTILKHENLVAFKDFTQQIAISVLTWNYQARYGHYLQNHLLYR